MIILGFVILSFILFATLGVGAFFYGRRELQQTLKAHVKRSAAQQRRYAAEISQLRADLDIQAANLKMFASEKKVADVLTPFGESPWRKSMEDRAAREISQEVVAVDNRMVSNR